MLAEKQEELERCGLAHVHQLHRTLHSLVPQSTAVAHACARGDPHMRMHAPLLCCRLQMEEQSLQKVKGEQELLVQKLSDSSGAAYT